MLYNFKGSPSEPSGFNDPGTLSQGTDGNIYTTSFSGGGFGLGIFFNMRPTGSLTELYTFGNNQGGAGCSPSSGVTLSTDGNFYGSSGGCGSVEGTVFSITRDGIPTGLHSFTGGDGANPLGAPVQGGDGSYYGTTAGGGSANCGTVYQITPAGSLNTLYQFDGTHGCNPLVPLTLGTDGIFYGTAESGGSNQFGVVFKITTTGVYTVLYNFDGTHGKYPFAPLVQGQDGNSYGTTLVGGAFNEGAVFKITSAGKLTVLHSFNPAALDGGAPVAGMVQAADLNFYGATQGGGNVGNGNGTIFRINSKGSYSVLYNFDSTTGEPDVTLSSTLRGFFMGLPRPAEPTPKVRSTAWTLA